MTVCDAPLFSRHVLARMIRTPLVLGVAVAAAGVPTLGAQPQSSQAPGAPTSATPAPAAVITFDTYPVGASALTVRATVRGQEGMFLWDTGEGTSMITPAFARRIGCTPWGQVTGYRMLGERIDTPRCDDLAFAVSPAAGAPALRLPAPVVIVFDLMSFYKSDAPRLDGALGLDVFTGRTITFQLARKRLVVESPASLAARVARATEVPIRVVREGGAVIDVFLGVQTPAGTAWMELDSGNSGPSVFVARYLAHHFQLDTTRAAPQPVRLAIGGRVPVETVARTLPRMAMDGNLGGTVLRQYDVTLDLAADRAWLAPAAQP